MKKESEEKEGWFEWAAILLGWAAIAMTLVAIANLLLTDFPSNGPIKDWLKENGGGEIYQKEFIDKTTMMVRVTDGCKFNLFGRTERCKWEYFIFTNKIGDEWVLNESSKVVIYN